MGGTSNAGLLERSGVLGKIARLAGDVARAGSGRVLVVEGAPGIGKTALLRAARDRIALAGMAVLMASGAELETALAFGVVRQLFAPVVAAERNGTGLLMGAPGLARAVIDPAGTSSRHDIDPGAVMHGLLLLCASLAAHTGLFLVVDDVQWADASSLAWIAYLSRRVRELPVLLVVAARPFGHAAGGAEVLDALSADAERVTLVPLSAQASATLLRRAVGPSVPDDICRACHDASGGNPFYLHELIAEGGESLTSGDRAPVEVMAPAGVVRTVIARLARLGPEAERLARAVAVLGDRSEVRHAAKLAQLEPEAAEHVIDQLAGASILLDRRPPHFAHPIVRAAVYDDLLEGARATLHRRAAQILHDDGADPTQVAVQLLSTQPHGDQWVVARLRDAARVARERGDARAAATYLARALREPADPAERSAVLLELGTVEHLLLAPAAAGHLREALRLAEDPGLRRHATFELTRALNQPGDLTDALALIEQTIPSFDDTPALAALLEVNRVGLASLHLAAPPDTAPARQLLTDLDRDDLPARLLRGVLGCDAVYRGRPASEAGALFDAAFVGDPARAVGDVNMTTYVAFTAALCERFEGAERVLTAALTRAQNRGAMHAAGQLWSFRADLYLRVGKVLDAETDARLSVDALDGLQLVAITPLRVDALVERNRPAEALELLRRAGGAGKLPAWLPSLVVLTRRIALWVAVGALDEALADLGAAERLAVRTGFADSAALPWRAEGALACLAAGETRPRAGPRRRAPGAGPRVRRARRPGFRAARRRNRPRRRVRTRAAQRRGRRAGPHTDAPGAREGAELVGCRSAPSRPTQPGSRVAHSRARPRRRLRRDRGGRADSGRVVDRGRPSPAQPHQRPRRFDRQPTPGRDPRRRGLVEPRDRPGPVPHPEDDRAPPDQRVRNAGDPVAQAVGGRATGSGAGVKPDRFSRPARRSRRPSS